MTNSGPVKRPGKTLNCSMACDTTDLTATAPATVHYLNSRNDPRHAN